VLKRDLTGKIIGAAIEVHRYWGPGLNECVYHRSLCKELSLRKIQYESEVRVPLRYKGANVGDDMRVDLWVEQQVIVELKAVAKLLPAHETQLLTYMKLMNARIGLLLNFNMPLLKEGIRCRVRRFPSRTG